MLDSRLQQWTHGAPLPTPISRRALPGAWREQLVLSDGRELVIRPIDAADAEPLRAGFGLLTAHEVRLRFLHPMRELTPELAKKLCNPRRGRDFALVVAENLPPGDALIGAVVRASLDDDGKHAEFAILVSHFLSGHGLGRYLMRLLIRWAKLKRLHELYGDVLDENTAMLELARSLGFRREHAADDPGVMHIRLPLRAQDAN